MSSKISIVGDLSFKEDESSSIKKYSSPYLLDFTKESHSFHSILIDKSLFNEEDDWIYLYDNQGKIFLYSIEEDGDILFHHYSTDFDLKMKNKSLTEGKLLKNFGRKISPPSSSKFIPKSIHLLWIDEGDIGKSESLLPSGYYPEKYSDSVKSIFSVHPDFEIKVWNYCEVRKLIGDTLGKEYVSAFDSYKKIISKCDFARMCIIYTFGGVYTDLDFYFRDTISTLFKENKILLWREPSEHQFYKYPLVCNGIFAAEKENLFILGWIEQMKNNSTMLLKDNVLISTGPEGLGKFYTSISRDRRPPISNHCKTLPFTKLKMLSRECLDCDTNPEKDIVAYTIWDEGTGWEKKALSTPPLNNLRAIEKSSNTLLLILIIIAVIIIAVVGVVVYLLFTSKNKKLIDITD